MTETPSVTVTRTINAPVDTVWEVATDLRQMPETMSAITDVEVLEGGEEFGVGTRWRETRVMMRKEATEEMYVSAVDHQRRYVVEADNAGVHYVTTLTFAPVNATTTEVGMTFTGQPASSQNIVARLMGKLGLRVVRKSLAKDLDDLAAASEAAHDPINPS